MTRVSRDFWLFLTVKKFHRLVNAVVGALMVSRYATISSGVYSWSLVMILNPVLLVIV